MSQSSSPEKPARLVSLDAYRGFVMLAMASAGLGLARVGKSAEILERFDQTSCESAWRSLWGFLAYQTEHVPWIGCSFWDLIQPSFMFMVGVALPYSYARRQALGESSAQRFAHVLLRSGILILLGIFLSSNWNDHTNYTFVNVLTQIGLGYPILYLLLGRGFKVQLAAVATILVGYWYAFYQHPLPGPDFDYAAVGVPADWEFLSGLAAHWNKNANFASEFDQWFLNLFPRPEPFVYNNGGYQTLNFIPSIATMTFGLMAGELLRSQRSPQQKVRRLWLAGAICLALGLAVDGHIWPFVQFDWSIAPIVKRIWTPSWAVFSSGWTFWMLAAFYWIIDIRGWKRWAFPLVVVGMNSIAMYVMSQLMKPWIGKSLKTHISPHLFDGPWGPMVQASSVLFVMWLICLWMYRQKIFVRI